MLLLAHLALLHAKESLIPRTFHLLWPTPLDSAVSFKGHGAEQSEAQSFVRKLRTVLRQLPTLGDWAAERHAIPGDDNAPGDFEEF